MIPQHRQDIEYVSRRGLQVERNDQMTRVTCLGGAFDMFMHNDDKSLTPSISSCGFWESWVTSWHVKNIGEGDIYIDLGANSGYYTFLAHTLGATPYAFEANPSYVELMQRSATINGIYIDIIHQAISHVKGKTLLNFYNGLDGSASIVGDGDGQFTTVPTSPLDSYQFPAGNMIIKMDIEGAEEMAWEGMKEILAIRKPTIIMEYTPGAYSKDFWTTMHKYGKITILDFEGEENLVTEAYAESHTDWITLVVRPYR